VKPYREVEPTGVFKVLADTVRWEIVQEMARHGGELPYSVLEADLPLARSTISHHLRVLFQADVIDVRKEGRRYFYRLRHDVLRAVFVHVERIAEGHSQSGPAFDRPFGHSLTASSELPSAVGDESPALPTW
jgi:DNA-binding transcriptional ArsR family regulator